MLINKINALKITEEDLKQTIKTIKEKTLLLKQTNRVDEAKSLIDEISICRNHYLTLFWASYIGYLKDITDEKYLASEEMIAKYEGEYKNAIYKLYEVLDSKEEKHALIKVYGKRFFDIAHNQKILLSSNEDLYTEENRLRRKYRGLINEPRIEFQKEKISLIKLSKYLQDPNEEIRKEAYDKRYKTLLNLSSDLSEIFKEIVQVRAQLAKATNFKNYADFSFIKMNRIDYTKEDLNVLKKTIIKYFVPIREKLKKKQASRLGEDNLSYYNEAILFKDGNAKTDLELTDILTELTKILEKLNPEFSILFQEMLQNGLIDLDERENKSGGGITTFLPDFKTPIFIKRYINNSQSLITIAHEFGHSLQLYYNKEKQLHENRWPTFDICEIHSTTMELLVNQYIESIYKEDTKKHLITHYTHLLDVLIKTSMLDDFQTKIYSEENLDINETWKELYKIYYPSDNYDIDYFTKGIMWQADINRIDDPFYGIDYALATIYAFSFLEKYTADREKTINEYIDFCKIGGEIAFKDIATNYDLANPFDEQSLKKLANFIENKVEEILK